MSGPEYCHCGHLRFGHHQSAGACDDCRCRNYRPVCDVCAGAEQVLSAPVTTRAVWEHVHLTGCPVCMP